MVLKLPKHKYEISHMTCCHTYPKNMLSPQHTHLPPHHHLPLLHHPLSTTTITFNRRHPPPISASSHPPPTNPPNQDTKILRTHNARSTSILFQTDPQSQTLNGYHKNEILKLLELSMAKKRTPQFPGSIYIQSPADTTVESSLPPIKDVFNAENDYDFEVIMRALEIRREVTLEIFKEAMRKGKFGITYVNNLGSRLFPEFIDYVMVQAAAMKQVPEFANSSFNVRAKACLEDCNVVPLIRWLKHNGLSYPQIGKLICNSKGNLESIRTTADWLKSIHVDGRFIGVALLRGGENVLQRSIEELDEIVSCLEKNGVKREWMGYIVSRCPELLSFSMEELETHMKFYFDMGMNEKDFGTMVFDFPKVLGFYSLEEMNQKVAYLKEFGLSNEDVGRLLAFRPQLMGCSIEERWKPLVKYFYYLGISRDGMRRILTVKPMVFCFDFEANIVRKVQFFRDIGVQEKGIASMLVRFPSLMTYSLHKKIRPVVIFLLTKAGVSQTNIGKVIGLGPELLGCSISKKLDPNVKYFLSLGIDLKTLGEMIADFPMLLRYNIDILRPKYRYLRRTMVRPLNDLIEFPRFFSYSLEDRIIPRHKILMDNRVNFKLRYMLSSTDDEFQQKVEAAVQRRRMFESGISNNIGLDSPTDDSSEDEIDDVDINIDVL
ncbi:putative transcription regulator mTERF family [Helianthus annuus]|nr:putative transcription regulator mTERF family [Helianthus annuus]KAJ0686598.1 putative transcription regulator mTERF family [Helianthus annuus]KAJ0690412.1 putative transcription regulator mTERF family [Helianthus annuus]KAJ0871952.1 putative transcription regulator mTERF family [Helianthus annuus]